MLNLLDTINFCMYNGSKTRRDIPPYPYIGGHADSPAGVSIVGHADISISITQNPQIHVEIAYKIPVPPGGPTDPVSGRKLGKGAS